MNLDDDRHPARREDLFHAEQPHRALHPAEGRHDDETPKPDPKRQLPRRLGVGIWDLVRWDLARRRRAHKRATGRRSRRRVRWRRSESSSRRTRSARSPTACRSSPCCITSSRRSACACSCGAGSAQDPKGKGGVANLTASLLDQGTTTRSAQQIADQIDFIGGDLGTGAATDLSFVNAVVMKDSFQTGMDLVADVARNPAFAPEEIERQKDQILSSLRVNADDPGYIADVVFDRLVYGFHPYGLPGSGTRGIAWRAHARRSAGVPSPVLRSQQHDPRHRRRRDERRGVRGRAAGVRRLAARRRCRRRRRSIRRRRRGASSSSTSRTPCRRASASGSLRFRESIPTTWRGTWP